MEWTEIYRTEPCKCCNGTAKQHAVSGAKLKQWRMENGVSQKVFADAIANPNTGKPPSFSWISNVEAERTPCPDWLLEAYRKIPESGFPPPGNAKNFERRKRLAEERFAQEGS